MDSIVEEALKIYIDVHRPDSNAEAEKYYEKIFEGAAVCFSELIKNINSFVVKNMLKVKIENALKEIAVAHKVPEIYLEECRLNKEEFDSNAVALYYLLNPVLKAADAGEASEDLAVECFTNLIEAKAVLEHCCLAFSSNIEKEKQAENEAIILFRKFLSRLSSSDS